MHIQAGYLFVPADGPVIYFDSEPGRHTGRQLETIDEVRDDLLPLVLHVRRLAAARDGAQVGGPDERSPERALRRQRAGRRRPHRPPRRAGIDRKRLRSGRRRRADPRPCPQDQVSGRNPCHESGAGRGRGRHEPHARRPAPRHRGAGTLGPDVAGDDRAWRRMAGLSPARLRRADQPVAAGSIGPDDPVRRPGRF